MLAVALLVVQGNGQPTLREVLGKPVKAVVEPGCLAWVIRRHQQTFAFRQRAGEILTGDAVIAFSGLPTGMADEFTERGIAAQRACQRDQPEAVADSEFAADDEMKAGVTRLRIRAHDTRHRALVSDSKSAVAAFDGGVDQFLGVRSTTQEAEIGHAVKLGVSAAEVERSLHTVQIYSIAFLPAKSTC